MRSPPRGWAYPDSGLDAEVVVGVQPNQVPFAHAGLGGLPPSF